MAYVIRVRNGVLVAPADLNLPEGAEFKIEPLDLSARTDYADEPELVNSPKAIGFWLGLFCIGLIIIAPVAWLIQTLLQLRIAERHTLGSDFMGFFEINAIAQFAIVFWGAMIGFDLWQRRQNALKRVKRFLILQLIWPAALWALTFKTQFTAYAAEASIRSLIFFAVWYSYFSWSQRIQEVFPE